MHLLLYLLFSLGNLYRAEELAEPMNYPECIWRVLSFRNKGAGLHIHLQGVMSDTLVKT